MDMGMGSVAQKKSVNEKIMEELTHPFYLLKIKRLLRDTYGLDAFQYRDSYFLRRISMISKRLHTQDLRQIYKHIEASHQGYLDFLNTLTIHVTEFFRDKSLWEYARDSLFMPLFSKYHDLHPQKDRPFRIWSAGCSSGQEPYSLAIMYLEAYRKHHLKLGRINTWSKQTIAQAPVEIVATDINARIIETAQKGIYDVGTLKNAEPRIIKNYFTKEGKKFHIRKEIKQKVKFKKIDLFQGPFPTHFDLVVCRNVVIYFTKDQQRILFRRFWESMRPSAFLIIGKSEMLPLDLKALFQVLEIREHVYKRLDLAELEELEA